MNVYGTRSEDLDDETLERAEREALQRPSNSAMWDSRLYSSHAPVIGWAERGDDLLSESNYLKVLEALQAEAGWTEHEDRDCCWTADGAKIGYGHDFEPHDDDVIDATIGDWLVGSLRQVFVRVREAFCATCGLQEDEDGDWPDTGEPSDGHWHQGDFTRCWRAAVAIGLALQDYPVFDESDYSEREHEAGEEAWQDWGRDELKREMGRHLDSLGYDRADFHIGELVRNWLEDLTDSDIDELVTPFHESGTLEFYREGEGFGGLPDVAKELVEARVSKVAADWDEYVAGLGRPQAETLPLTLA